MAIRCVKTEEFSGGLRKTFSFGAYRGNREIEGTIYFYDDGSAKINLPFFKCLSFKSIATAEKFIKENFSCKGDLVKAVVDHEVFQDINSPFYLSHYEKPKCADYYDSKYSFKRERGRWAWEIRNEDTGENVGNIDKLVSRDYSLSFGKVQIAVCTTRPEAEKLAREILNKGLSIADILYTHKWLKNWKQLGEYWAW